MNKYLAENKEDEFIIGGDFNTVLEPDVDKIGGLSITHAKSREIIKTGMEGYDLNNILRLLNNNTMQFTLHSSSKSYIFLRFNYFLVSESIVNSVCDCTIIPGFKCDHSIITMNIHLTPEQRGPGYFKINNSLLLHNNYQVKIRNAIRETAEINSSANPNVLWEVIKGAIRNKTMQYATRNKKYKRTKKTN